MAHYSDDDLILHHYGEHPDSRAIADHLETCGACRDELILLERVLGVVDADAGAVPERGEAYGAEVWQRLRPRLPARVSWRDRLLPQWHGWRSAHWAPQVGVVGAFAVLLIAAFVAGRYSPHTGGPATTTSAGTVAAASPENVRERVLLIAVGDHLDRSQMVLAELVNAAPANSAARASVDISDAQQFAGDLVASNRLYRQSAAQTGDAGLQTVLDELEPILMEIAHSPASISGAELDGLKQRIESQGLLFKIHVVGSNVRERERVAPRPGNPVS